MVVVMRTERNAPEGTDLRMGEESLPAATVKQYCVLCSEIAPPDIQTARYRWGTQKDLRFGESRLLFWFLSAGSLQDNASKRPCLSPLPVIAAINLKRKEPLFIGVKGWSTADQLERRKSIRSIVMSRSSPLRWLVATTLLLTGCSSSALNTTDKNASKATLERLELRVNQLERQLNDIAPSPSPSDSKTPAGPIRSLTLRLGTDDDRLRLYWGDGQTSDLACSQEGKGIWACG